MSFSAKRCAYSDMPSFSSQSAICCIAAPYGFSAIRSGPAGKGTLPHVLLIVAPREKALYRPEHYARPPDSAMNVAVRGRMILISVNSPGCVSTSIDPECCFTMMS